MLPVGFVVMPEKLENIEPENVDVAPFISLALVSDSNSYDLPDVDIPV